MFKNAAVASFDAEPKTKTWLKFLKPWSKLE